MFPLLPGPLTAHVVLSVRRGAHAALELATLGTRSAPVAVPVSGRPPLHPHRRALRARARVRPGAVTRRPQPCATAEPGRLAAVRGVRTAVARRD